MTDASEGPTPAAAQQTPTISSVSVALAPPKSALRNEKRILRRLRVQILDCRSGEAIRNRTLDEVLIDGEEALRFPDAPEWDIAENEYISSKTWKPSALARALDALGYEPPERVSRWHHLDAALQAYRRDEEGLDEGDELPKISKKKLRRKWGKAALAEYRRNYFEAVQQHLTGLGFPCNEASDDGKLAADEPGSWGKKSKFEYKRWQRLELGRRKPAAWPTNAKRAKELVDGRHRFKSDAKGVVHIPIPVTKFADGFKLRFSLAHFPLVREELKVLERAESSAEERNQGGVPTGFGIEWHDSQDLAAELGPFGWRVRTPAAAETETSELPEFQRSIEVEFPKSEHKSFRKLAGEKPELFQKFYGQGPREAELVVFALVWAQPVYTEFENPPAGTRVDENGVYIQHDAHRPKGLQIVTMKTDLGGSALFGGKGYGVFERVLYQRWRGKTIEVLPALLRMRELGLFPKTIPSTCVAADPPSSGEAPVFREGEGESVSSLTPKELLWTYQTYRKTKEPSMAWIDEAIRAYQKPFYERDVARRVKKKHQHHMNGELHNKTRKMLGRELDGIRSDRFKDRRWGHAGYDLHVKAGNRWAGGSRAGSPVFAIHGGRVTRTVKWSGRAKSSGGSSVALRWTGTGHNGATFLHLDEVLVKKKELVRSGQIIGRGGNTGNFGRPSGTTEWDTKTPYPSHLHLNVGKKTWRSGSMDNRLYAKGPPDDFNRAVLPCNSTPLLLPCKCEVPVLSKGEKHKKLGDKNLANCEFGAGSEFLSTGDPKKYVPGVPSTCWAVAELRCPWMPKEIDAASLEAAGDTAKQARRRVQAQLRYLAQMETKTGKGGGYLEPGALDGDFGRLPTKARPKLGKARRAIRAFLAANKLLDVADPHAPSNTQMSAEALAILDRLAPVHDQGFALPTPDDPIDPVP